MWNQGNGNGQGNGYGQGANDTYDRLNGYTRELGGARFPFMEASGRYALAVLEEFQHTSDGPSARALFKVIECKGKHPVGSFVVKIWKLVKPPKYQNKPSDGELFTDFCRKLKGAPAGYPMGNDIRVLMKERPQEQLARGTVIDAVGVPNQKGTWVDIYWNTVPQAPADIAAMRQRLEAEGIPDTGGRASPTSLAQAYPANPQYQMSQTQYGLPPGAQPVQAPVQQGMPQQGWGQPQQTQTAPQTQAAPQGGYLANVPPQGNNGNGGSGTW